MISISGATFSNLSLSDNIPVPPPLPGTGIVMRPTVATMQYWATYLSDWPTVAESATTEFDPAKTGSNGVLSSGNTIVDFSGNSGALGNNGLVGMGGGNPVAWEFLINEAYPTRVGYWATGGPAFNKEESDGGNSSFAVYYESTGTINGYGDTISVTGYTQGDVIGAVYEPDTARIHFYKNGVNVGFGATINAPGYILAGRLV